MVPSYSQTIEQRKRLRWLAGGLLLLGGVLFVRLFDLQILQHGRYAAEANHEHTLKYEIPARRGQLYVHDGATSTAPLALDQTLNVLWADPRYVKDQPAVAAQLAAITGGSAASYVANMRGGIEYAVLGNKISNDAAAKIKALKIAGIGLTPHDYRTYPEGSLAAQVLGFVNDDGQGQYGIEQYLNSQLSGKPGQLAAKTDTNGIPIATAANTQKAPTAGVNYLLTIDRNVQAEVEQELAARIKEVKAKSGSVVIMDPSNGNIIAMATYPAYDPNSYSQVTNYDTFLSQPADNAYEPGSGMKVFTMATGLDQGKVTANTVYDDPGCYVVDGNKVCDAAGDHPGPNKTMTVVLRDSLNTGVMFVLRMLGGDPNNFTLAGKKLLYEYFTQHFGFGERTGVEQANEPTGVVNAPTNASGNDVNFANMTFGQGVTVTMMQMVAAMSAIANGGKLFQPHLIDAIMNTDGGLTYQKPKLIRDHVISLQAISQLNQMLEVVVEHGSGYTIYIDPVNKKYKIAGKTGTAQIPDPNGGYKAGANVGSFIGYAPADTTPKFVMMVRINEPQTAGYAEFTTVPLFSNITHWLFNYYNIAPSVTPTAP